MQKQEREVLMTQQIIMIFGNRTIRDTAASIAREMGESIPIYNATIKKGFHIAERAAEKGTQVIISRGAMGEHLRKVLDIPVVTVKYSIVDYIMALQEARQYDDKIAIVLFSQAYRMLTGVKELLGEDVKLVYLQPENDIDACVEMLAEEGYHTVVAGETFQEAALKYGMNVIPPKCDEELVKEAIAESKHYLRIFHERELRYEMVNSLLDCASEGIVAIDSQGRISNINHSALNFFEAPQRSLIGMDVRKVFRFPKMAAVLSGGLKLNGELTNIANRLVAVNAVPVQWEQGETGAVITIHDSRQIQEMEQNIRRRNQNKGHVTRYSISDIIGSSPVIMKAKEKALLFAKSDASTLILGETGVGKELFAQSIHSASIRQKNPFVAVNCAALPRSIIESELFGYVRGAFTGARSEGKAGLFEQAHTGTIFLDEISELPIDIQSRLLRVLQEHEITRAGDDKVIPIDLRILAASNKNLQKEVEEGRFRKDLYYRLSVLILPLPSLSQRSEDIPEIVNSFLKKVAIKQQLPLKTIEGEAMERLKGFQYPGNIRQLRNIVERAAIYSSDNVITMETIEEVLQEENIFSKEPVTAAPARPDMAMERIQILDMLERNGGNRQKTAEALGMSRSTLWRKCKLLGIPVTKESI